MKGQSSAMGSKSQSIVAVDDDVRTLDRISMILDSTFVVLATADPNRALAWLKNDTTVGAVVVGQSLCGGKGLELLKAAQKLRPDARRILIASYSDLAGFVDGLHTGAIERTIYKPIDATELLGLVRLCVPNPKPGDPAQIAVA
jgi:DNA-binding NtrC family response regulator